eukprot:6485027-Amphidinium_carterae.1
MSKLPHSAILPLSSGAAFSPTTRTTAPGRYSEKSASEVGSNIATALLNTHRSILKDGCYLDQWLTFPQSTLPSSSEDFVQVLLAQRLHSIVCK